MGLSVLGLTAFAQTAQDTAAPTSRLTVSAGADYDDDGTSAFTSAVLDINQSTRTQKFQLQASTGYDFGFGDADDGWRDPRVTLSYDQQSGPLSFGIDLGYTRSDLDGLLAADPDDPTIETTDFILDAGTRISRSGSLQLVYGARAPFGATLTLAASELDYVDTTDVRLVDQLTTSADLGLRFSVSPVLDVTAGFGMSRTEQQDEFSSRDETQRASLGFSGQVSKVLTVDGSVSWNEVTQSLDDGAGGRVSASEDGLGFDLGATIAQRNGSTRFSYARDIETAGESDRLRLTRTTNLSETQQLQFSVGASRLDGAPASLEADIAWSQALKNGRFSIRAAQQSRFTDDDLAAQTRQLTAVYATDLTAVSSLSADLSLSSISYDDAPSLDSQSWRVGVGYTHQLARDWDISSRAYFAVVEDDTTTDKSRGVSVQLNRNFDLFK